jgi:hypothetical protein
MLLGWSRRRRRSALMGKPISRGPINAGFCRAFRFLIG